MFRSKRIALTLAAAALVVLGSVGDARGAGWSSGLQTARSVGMGNAFHAISDAPIALHFNPAGMTLIDRDLAVQLGVHVPFMLNYSADMDYIPAAGGATERNLHESKVVPIIPHLLVTTNALDRFMPKDFHLALGIGWYVPMGGGTVDFQKMKLDVNDPTNLSGFRSELALHYLSVGAAFSWKNLISIGANFNVHFTDIALKQSNYPKFSAATFTNNFIDNEFAGFGAAFSGSFGLMLQDPNEIVKLGVSYKMKYTAHAEGTTTFDVKTPSAKALILGLGKSAGFTLPVAGDTEVNFVIPDVLAVGISFKPIERFVFGVSIDWTLWSQTEKLTLDWAGLNIPKVLSGILADEVNLYTGYDDVLTLMVGGEFQVLKDNLPIRVGYIYNPAAKFDNANSQASVDTTSHIITWGLGYRVDLPKNMSLDIDVGIYHLLGEKTEVTQAFLEGSENMNADGLPIFSGPSGEYNKNILVGGILDLILKM